MRMIKMNGLCEWGKRKALIFCLILSSVSEWVKAQDPSASLRILPAGNTVEVRMQTVEEGEYMLESVAKIMEGEEWAPLMQFRGRSAKPRNWVDPMCGAGDARFFRLKKLLEAPRPQVSNFRLIDVKDNDHELYYHWPAKGVVLLLVGNTIQHAIDLAPALDDIRNEWGEENILTWIISTQGLEEREELATATAHFSDQLPVLQDTTQAVTRTLGTGFLPESILISTSDWSVAYQGPVSVEIDTGLATLSQQPLRDAVSDLLQDRSAEVSRLAVFGEKAALPAIRQATYAGDIAPLLQKHCFPCHTEGNIAPWAMTSHSVVSEFSGLIKSAVLAGEMPPWHADPKYGHFSNAKALAANELDMLVDWIDRGSPKGPGGDPLAENPPVNEADWPLGKPDAVISIPTQSIPATGVIDYKYLISQSPFASDVWLKAVHVKPGDRSVVHHCLVFTGSFSELLALRGGLAGFFAGYVPGMEQTPFPKGTGKLLKRSDNIVFQMHYTVSGKATTDQTQLGLYLADAKPERELITSSAYDTSFTIPPNSREVQVSARQTFSNDTVLYEFSPHMHYRGSSARYTLIFPDGSRQTLLNVPAYFFDWQALYRLKEPLTVPRGSVLLCEGTFDNSVQNRFNPDPNATVRFGEQSWEEMFIGYFNYSTR